MSQLTQGPVTEGQTEQCAPAVGERELTTKEKWRLLACLLFVLAAIFAITSMEAPFYMDYHPDSNEIANADSHIGAPWRYKGISVLWYISAGMLMLGSVFFLCAWWKQSR